MTSQIEPEVDHEDKKTEESPTPSSSPLTFQWKRWKGHFTALGGLVRGEIQVMLRHPQVQCQEAYNTELQLLAYGRTVPYKLQLQIPSSLVRPLIGHKLPSYSVMDYVWGRIDFDVHVRYVDEPGGELRGKFNLTWPKIIKGSYKIFITPDPVVITSTSSK